MLFGLGEPCPSVSLLLLCSLVYFFFFHLGNKEKKKRCYPKNCRLRQRSSEKEYIIIYRRIQFLSHLGKSLLYRNSGKVRKGCTFLSATEKPYIDVCTHVCVCLGHVILLQIFIKGAFFFYFSFYFFALRKKNSSVEFHSVVIVLSSKLFRFPQTT